MLLIIILGLIATFALGCDGCDAGTSNMTDFDWSKVRVTVSTGFLKQTAFRTAACVYI
jgi:hypothetical protein